MCFYVYSHYVIHKIDPLIVIIKEIVSYINFLMLGFCNLIINGVLISFLFCFYVYLINSIDILIVFIDVIVNLMINFLSSTCYCLE